MSRLTFLPMLALSLLSGCATPVSRPLMANHPASEDAPEAVIPPPRRMLEVDRATRRTSQLIAARAEQESQGQAQQTRPDKMGDVKNMPGKRQEHREHQDVHENQ